MVLGTLASKNRLPRHAFPKSQAAISIMSRVPICNPRMKLSNSTQQLPTAAQWG